MPRQTPPARLVLWDDLHLNLYGPAHIENYRTARWRVAALMNSFSQAIRDCMKDQVREFPVLKRFRVKVQL